MQYADAKIKELENQAKEIRSLAERMVSMGKEGSLHSRRRALAFLTDEKVVDKLFNELAPRYADRAGGYIRVIKLGRRLGDGAPTAQIEFIK